MRTDPSNTASPVLGRTFGTSSMQPIKFDLFPEHIWPHFDKEGGCFNVLWLKNSFVSPPLIWVAIYVCENNLTCILSSFVKHFKDCRFAFPALKRGKLFFFIWVSRVTVRLMGLESRNSWNCFLPSEYWLLTAHKTSSLYHHHHYSLYLWFHVGTTLFCHLPKMNCLVAQIQPPISLYTLESNFFWKLSDFSWWWNSVCSFLFRTVTNSNSCTTLATSGLRTCQRLNFFCSLLIQLIPHHQRRNTSLEEWNHLFIYLHKFYQDKTINSYNSYKDKNEDIGTYVQTKNQSYVSEPPI